MSRRKTEVGLVSDGEHHVSPYLRPRLCSLAEVLWEQARHRRTPEVSAPRSERNAGQQETTDANAAR